MTDPTPPNAPASPSVWMIFALVAAAFVGAAGTLWSGWLGDDIAMVRDNEALLGGGAVARALSATAHPGPSEPGAYRPVTLASFALTATMAGEGPERRDPFVDHLVNVFLHVLATVLLFLTILRLAPTAPVLAFASALVFAVHPVHVRTLAPLSGRADLLALVFSCTTALAWLAFRRGNHAMLPLAVVAWFLALGSHEVALGVPALLALVPAQGAPRRWAGFAAFVPALLLYLIGGGGPSGDGRLGVGDHLLGGMAAFGNAVMQWLLPVRLPTETVHTVGAPGDPGRIVAFVVLGLTLLFVLRAALGRSDWLSRGWCAAMLLFSVPLCLYAGSAPVGSSLGYVVSAPLALAAGCAAMALWNRGLSLSLGLAGLAAVGALAFVSVSETVYWRDDETRFSRRMALDPDDVEGQAAFARFLRSEAEIEQQRAVLLRADDPERTRALARREAMLVRAGEWALRATQGRGRSHAASWREKGLILAARTRWADALPDLLYAAELDPRLSGSTAQIAQGGMKDLAEVFFAIGRAHEALGRRDEAAEPFRHASKLDPEKVLYRQRAGQALTRIGRYLDGLPMLRQAFREAEDPAQRKAIGAIIESEERAATLLSSRYLREGRKAQEEADHPRAAKAFERALEVNDQLVEAQIQVGWLRGWWFGKYKLGYEHLDKAERILRKRNAKDPRLKDVDKYRKALRKSEREDDDRLRREAEERKRGKDDE